MSQILSFRCVIPLTGVNAQWKQEERRAYISAMGIRCPRRSRVLHGSKNDVYGVRDSECGVGVGGVEATRACVLDWEAVT